MLTPTSIVTFCQHRRDTLFWEQEQELKDVGGLFLGTSAERGMCFCDSSPVQHWKLPGSLSVVVGSSPRK